MKADLTSGLSRYPVGSDVEFIAALRHLLRESGRRPEELDERAGFCPGTVATLAAGYVEPSGPLLRRLCRELRIPRWSFHLIGTVVVGADVGNGELAELLEKRRRLRCGNPDRITATDIAVEAIEILLAIGEDHAGSGERGARGGLVDGAKRLARRATRLGEPGASCLFEAVAVIVGEGVESLSGSALERVVALVELGRSLERALPTDHEGEAREGERVASLMASITTALRGAIDLLSDEELSRIGDVELRRLVTMLAVRLRGTRLAFSELEKYYQQVYGGSR